jgi:hypothetical protein
MRHKIVMGSAISFEQAPTTLISRITLGLDFSTHRVRRAIRVVVSTSLVIRLVMIMRRLTSNPLRRGTWFARLVVSRSI